MDLNKLNDRLESSSYYQFMIKHKKAINIIEGFFIIGLLIAINIYVVQDHFLKKQIAENCGYVTSTYKCICEKHYADDWESLQNNFKINISNVENVSA